MYMNKCEIAYSSHNYITIYLIIIKSIYTIIYDIIQYLYCLNVNLYILYTLCVTYIQMSGYLINDNLKVGLAFPYMAYSWAS